MTTTSKKFLSAMVLSATAVLANAQDQAPPEGGRQRGGDRGGDRGGFNMDEFRQRMNDRLKTALKVTDDEWTVLQPLMEAVQTKQRDAMSSRFGGFGGGRGGDRGGDRGPGGGTSGGGGSGGDQAARPGAAESDALRKALESDSTAAADLKAKLDAVRAQRTKSAAELAAAREALAKVVTVRQEAVLVSMGILE